MYRECDTKNGIPARLDRTPEEIRREMVLIKERIEETNSMLNIREILLNILSREKEEPKEDIIGELECAVDEARCALLTLQELWEELDRLGEELSEVRWLFGN